MLSICDTTDLLLSAAPIESHVGAIVVSGVLPLVVDTRMLRSRPGFSERLCDDGHPCGNLRRCERVSLVPVRVLCAERALQDIMPKASGLQKKSYGQCAIRSDGVL